MACYNGKNGALAIGSVNIAQLTSWTISESVDTVECTYMGQDWKNYHAGIREWEGSFEAIYDGNDQGQDAELATGASITINAYPDKDDVNHKFNGTAIITSIEHSAELEDVVRVTGSFTGTGALNVDTDSAA